jgi:prophage maintenance system killer protein
MENKKNNTKGEIIIYETSKKEVKLDVRLGGETVWLTQAQIALLFGSERSVITKHLRNIFQSGELDEKSNVQKMHIADSDKPVKFYDLDAIISIGYRVNSKRATQFRVWATKTLKDYLVKGYAINEKRLLEAKETFSKLQKTVAFLREKSQKELLSGQSQEILDLLADYAKTLSLLEQYDAGEIKRLKGNKTKFILKYESCSAIIFELKSQLSKKREAGDLFGMERGGAFSGIITNLYQTFGGKALYDTFESKAAHLLYFIIKDHPFSDGNKRIGSFLFVYFLDKEKYSYRKNGERKINDNALVALALLIAESAPKEKELMVDMIINLLVD